MHFPDVLRQPRHITAMAAAVLATVFLLSATFFSADDARLPILLPGDSSVVAHRGAGNLAPENTLAAINTSIQLGVDAVEIDTRQTRDNELVLMHDASFDRTTNGTGRINNKPFSYTENIVVDKPSGSHESVPRLRDALRVIDRADIPVFIEAKDTNTTQSVYETVRETGTVWEASIISFHWQDINALEATLPVYSPVETGYLYRGPPCRLFKTNCNPTPPHDVIHAAAEHDVDYVLADYRTVNLSWFTEHAQEHGVKPGYWTVNKDKAVTDVFATKPRVVITDRPQELMQRKPAVFPVNLTVFNQTFTKLRRNQSHKE